MTVATPTLPTTDEALVRLDELLDLSNIRMKLADPDESKGYDMDHLDLLESEYRKFLALHLAYPEMDVVPCKIVDEIWHQHILDTIAYRDTVQLYKRSFATRRHTSISADAAKCSRANCKPTKCK